MTTGTPSDPTDPDTGSGPGTPEPTGAGEVEKRPLRERSAVESTEGGKRGRRRQDPGDAPVHAHGHSHGGGGVAIHASRGSQIVLWALTLALLVGTVFGLVRLWPTDDGQSGSQQLLAPGVSILTVKVTAIPTDRTPEQSVRVTAEGTSGDIDGREVSVEVPPEVAMSGLHVGDRLRVLSVADMAAEQGTDTGEGAVSGDGSASGGDGDQGDDLDPADLGLPVSDGGGGSDLGLPSDGGTTGTTDSGTTGTDTGTGQDAEMPAPTGDPDLFYYFDGDRDVPLGILFVLYLVVVGLVARGRGLRAVVGLAAGVAIIVVFMLPAILAGRDPVLVALVAGAAMIFPCVYFAHGISVRTTTAILGTFGGLAVTVGLALVSGPLAGMTGTDGDAAMVLFGQAPMLSLSAIFLAGVIISGLGTLNDVTITQASSAWELRAAMPDASRWAIFTATMRIGRDHIASTVYTLAYAYIGSALPTLLVASTIERSLLDTLTAGEIAAEVFRTLVASTGLVLAIPLTTAIAAALASVGPTNRARGRRRDRDEELLEPVIGA